ncbi:MAG: ferric reductase-like transmembrane domain-containing protein [Acidimicrobiales bacterium]|jgi:DMSO/TMAO reductase YedYZ heme-binding membrane subunit
MTPLLAVATGHGSTAMWYLTRSTGLVSLVLLTSTVVLGMVASVGWTTERWPRFVSQAVHRNLSLLCLVLIAIHVVTTVADGYVPIGYVDAFVPFLTAYRPLWVGLGALALDLLLAVAVTSGLRRRIGANSWRSIHWLAYLCWPIALLHALGAGSDTRLSVAMLIEWLCVAAVVATGAWRLTTGRARTAGWRVGTALAGLAVVIGIAIFALLGPLRPGWSHRAGTSATLLGQLGSSGSTTAPSGAAPTSTTAPSPSSGLPAAPFSASVSGTYKSTKSGPSGQVDVVLTMTASDLPGTPLVVSLQGTPVNGGVAMSSSQVTWGGSSGQVTGLDGSAITATVAGGSGSLDLTMDLNLDQSSGSVTGTVSGTAAEGNR